MMVAVSADEPHEITVAWNQLQDHQTDRSSGECVVCGVPGPCAVANEAAAFLVERGVPVVDERLSTSDRRLARLTIIARFRRHARRYRGPR